MSVLKHPLLHGNVFCLFHFAIFIPNKSTSIQRRHGVLIMCQRPVIFFPPPPYFNRQQTQENNNRRSLHHGICVTRLLHRPSLACQRLLYLLIEVAPPCDSSPALCAARRPLLCIGNQTCIHSHRRALIAVAWIRCIATSSTMMRLWLRRRWNFFCTGWLAGFHRFHTLLMRLYFCSV